MVSTKMIIKKEKGGTIRLRMEMYASRMIQIGGDNFERVVLLLTASLICRWVEWSYSHTGAVMSTYGDEIQTLNPKPKTQTPNPKP